MEDLGERFQDFYRCLEADLRAGGEGAGERVGEERERMSEARVREVMEAVEKVLCELFYDRCVFSFRPSFLGPRLSASFFLSFILLS